MSTKAKSLTPAKRIEFIPCPKGQQIWLCWNNRGRARSRGPLSSPLLHTHLSRFPILGTFTEHTSAALNCRVACGEQRVWPSCLDQDRAFHAATHGLTGLHFCIQWDGVYKMPNAPPTDFRHRVIGTLPNAAFSCTSLGAQF